VFVGRPYYNSDTGGFAMVNQGQRSVDIAFDREILSQPVVNANVALEKYGYEHD